MTYAPDLSSCIAAADTRDEVVELVRGAIERISRACAATATRCRRPKTTAGQVHVTAFANSLLDPQTREGPRR